MMSTGHNELTHAVLENLQRRSTHTREVQRESIPPDTLAAIEELERFAAAASEQVNRCNADILACREEIAALNARLNAVLNDPVKHGLTPMAHYHDTQGVKAA